jgi:hypothetical protein
MTGSFKILLAAVCSAVFIPALLIGSCAYRAEQYRDGFSQIELGQSKEKVLNLMGTPSEIGSCGFPVDDRYKKRIGVCFEIFAYKGGFEQWALAFDRDGKLIEKYYWFLGEYGNKPPTAN